MGKLIRTLLLLAIAGCAGKPTVSVTPVAQDELLTPYLVTFRFEAKKRKIRLPEQIYLKFVPDLGKAKDDDHDIIGLCSESRGTPVVTIDREYFDAATVMEREELMYHEFGHCLLDLDHDNSTVDGRPKSIMHWLKLPAHIYTKYHDYYIDELFLD